MKKDILKICPNCLNSFKAVRKFCTIECCREYESVPREITYKNGSYPKKQCKVCGKEFSSPISNQKFCSSICRIQNQNRNKKIVSLDSIYWQVLNRDNFQCQYCGQTPSIDGIKLHIDHIKPQIDGGKTEIDNLVTACKKCNVIKAAQPLRHEAEFKKRLQKKSNPIDIQKSFDFLLGKKRKSEND